MQNNAFTPFGPTYLVDTGAPVQVKSGSGAPAPTSYRIRNTSSSANYFAWAPALPSGSVPLFGAAAPTAGNPAVNIMGMIGASVEVFQLPANCWFIANLTALEITPGEGF